VARLSAEQKRRRAAALAGWEARRKREASELRASRRASRLRAEKRAAKASPAPKAPKPGPKAPKGRKAPPEPKAKAPPAPKPKAKPRKAPPAAPKRPRKAPAAPKAPKPRPKAPKPGKAPPKPKAKPRKPTAPKRPRKAPPTPKPKSPKLPAQPRKRRHRHLHVGPEIQEAFPHIRSNGVWSGHIEPIPAQRRDTIETKLLELEDWIRPLVEDLDHGYIRLGFKVQIKTDHKYDKRRGAAEIWGHYHKCEATSYCFVNGLALAENVMDWGDRIIAILCELVIARKRPEEPFYE